MTDLELCYLPATEALQRFKSKLLSPVELLDAMLQRIEETEPVINSLTFKHFDEARDRAKKLRENMYSASVQVLWKVYPLGSKMKVILKVNQLRTAP